ncbi:hypothetical protein [Streptomyces africanus]|uniref:hypothetical protein n=1 Tax=Streptomyces africanus TaxID=231024 RepID=UPI000A3D1BA0|nr:hypothetical protein [Streptomyces africanus]
MRTTWASWTPGDMQEAAELEGWVGLTALKVPEQKLVETLPYYGGLTDYQAHVTACADCRRDDRPDCAEGEMLLTVSRIGVEEQHRLAASN